ncbi:MAG: HI0074 family nucleotidyltransferase substrate-binding subunit [Methylococcales bacterium]
MNDSTWILEDYAAALEQLEVALAEPAQHDVVKAGCIQYFEFCFELAWKSIKVVINQTGLPECLSPKTCLRQAYTQGWITVETTWLKMLDARNRMSHTYDAKKALEIYRMLPEFHIELKSLLLQLQSISEDEEL